jgi:hypothetical protein
VTALCQEDRFRYRYRATFRFQPKPSSQSFFAPKGLPSALGKITMGRGENDD